MEMTMLYRRRAAALLVAILLILAPARAQEVPPGAGGAVVGERGVRGGGGKLPFIQVDAKARQVRVECEAIHNEEALEFFCCSTGGNEHESVLRSKVKPSDLHLALLMIGLTPGEPVRFSEAANKWLPPHGPPIQISVEFEKDGKLVNLPGYRLMKNFATKDEAAPFTWIFVGSRMTDDNRYAGDLSGYIVSVVNFDATVIDVPQLASNANETLQWVTNVTLLPSTGTKVTMILEPAGRVIAPGTRPAEANEPPAKVRIDQQLVTIDAGGKVTLNGQETTAGELALKLKDMPNRGRVIVAVATPIEETPAAREVMNALSNMQIKFEMKPQSGAAAAATTSPTGAVGDAEEAMKRLRDQWQASVAPQAGALREAAKTHNQVIAGLRREQQKLIDEADRIQRVIDELEKKYQDLTTPQTQAP